jgi:hypothetical protein
MVLLLLACPVRLSLLSLMLMQHQTMKSHMFKVAHHCGQTARERGGIS